jgi:alkylhydroperoxidase family enzyme
MLVMTTSSAPVVSAIIAAYASRQGAEEMDMYETELPIRDDLIAAQEATVDRWSHPGTWWTGEERLAIVAEVRRARDAEEIPPPWVRASEVEGAVAQDHLLPAAAVDAIWRLTNHPGTLTADWCEKVLDGFGDHSAVLTPLQYTELVGLVAQANCIDRFSDALSLDRPTLPEPVQGDPSRSVPDGVAIRDHWVPTIESEVREVVKALSGVPAEKAASFKLAAAHYLPVAQLYDLTADRNSLTRMQVELVAARTSKLNECFY